MKYIRLVNAGLVAQGMGVQRMIRPVIFYATFGLFGLLSVFGQSYGTYNNDEANERLKQSLNSFNTTLQDSLQKNNAEQQRITADRNAAKQAFIAQQQEMEQRIAQNLEAQRQQQQNAAQAGGQSRPHQKAASAQVVETALPKASAIAAQAAGESSTPARLPDRDKSLNTENMNSGKGNESNAVKTEISIIIGWTMTKTMNLGMLNAANYLRKKYGESPSIRLFFLMIGEPGDEDYKRSENTYSSLITQSATSYSIKQIFASEIEGILGKPLIDGMFLGEEAFGTPVVAVRKTGGDTKLPFFVRMGWAKDENPEEKYQMSNDEIINEKNEIERRLIKAKKDRGFVFKKMVRETDYDKYYQRRMNDSGDLGNAVLIDTGYYVRPDGSLDVSAYNNPRILNISYVQYYYSKYGIADFDNKIEAIEGELKTFNESEKVAYRPRVQFEGLAQIIDKAYQDNLGYVPRPKETTAATTVSSSVKDRLATLKNLRESEAITEAEYQEQRARILKDL